MHDIILGAGVIAFIVYAGFSIYSLLSLKRTGDEMRRMLGTDVRKALAELHATLENTRQLTDDAKAVVENIRQVTETAAQIEAGLRALYGRAKEEVEDTVEANMAGVRAGFRTGFATLARNLNAGRGDQHDGGDQT